MSRFDILLHGDADEAAAALDDKAATPDELRVALINALRRIDRLERFQREQERAQRLDY